ncbi:tRNA (5-methylaminomethyl-2-thiouridine)(34)-methyltransferase MnmD [Hwangdonia lutea]|uniref:tRNA (5-methylaminomethyl-2-thiouridine)(34)-methyltransferase MnmD n=1 Tax=Hwangdonia lutea TaxID=3075823 RepID=A0AA97EMV4_9FLAO|nr:tRNA (5-methylaminomethyl-2-thiouridine)(34)-methyltransferase MnmD [Hwangdonia sp. SCSIO 19198]WOD44336.1 tRNA (5-methylaminomethyl-2-thiouridine)(34)-methyltransferase MnmD [Hwangdonia sp. SCSIO 19198]
MQRKIVKTADGSTTIHLPEWDEQYHSKHGAIQEAYHVFVKHGLHYFVELKQSEASQKTKDDIVVGESEKSNNISILEIGFGTGLNAFITLLEAEKLKTNMVYSGVEAYPVLMDEINQLNYPIELKAEDKSAIFKELHEVSWEALHKITRHFSLKKQKRFFSEIKEKSHYNIIYFDAFGARVQPELWTESIFQNMYDALKVNGVLVTYSAKGSVRRAMEAVGFKVQRLPGPPGKREMLRACKKA